MKDNHIILTPVKITPAESTLEDVRDKDKIEALGLKDDDTPEAIHWAGTKQI